jgi:hypothetical protein
VREPISLPGRSGEGPVPGHRPSLIGDRSVTVVAVQDSPDGDGEQVAAPLTAQDVLALCPTRPASARVAALAVNRELGLALAVVVHDDDPDLSDPEVMGDGHVVEGHELSYNPEDGWRIGPWPERDDVAAIAGWNPARADGAVRVRIGRRYDSAPVSAWGYWAYLTRIEPGSSAQIEVLTS